jgi:hypothetical protein
MRNTAIIISVMFWCFSCGPRNEYFNPFDNEFRFHRRFNLADYDTIRIECGYWNLTNRNDGGYYQFYIDSPGVVGKGFNVYIDVAVPDTTRVLTPAEFWEIVESNPIDLAELKSKVSKLNIKDVRYVRTLSDVFIVGTEEERMDSVNSLGLVYMNDSIYFPSWHPIHEGNKVIWWVGYFNAKPLN